MSKILDTCALQLLCQRRHNSVLLLGETGLQLRDHGVQRNLNTLLLRVSVRQTHLLDTALTSGKLFLAEDDGEGDVALLGGLELLGKFGLQLVGKLGLVTN